MWIVHEINQANNKYLGLYHNTSQATQAIEGIFYTKSEIMFEESETIILKIYIECEGNYIFVLKKLESI